MPLVRLSHKVHLTLCLSFLHQNRWPLISQPWLQQQTQLCQKSQPKPQNRRIQATTKLHSGSQPSSLVWRLPSIQSPSLLRRHMLQRKHKVPLMPKPNLRIRHCLVTCLVIWYIFVHVSYNVIYVICESQKTCWRSPVNKPVCRN